jgi:hypothetical protein
MRAISSAGVDVAAVGTAMALGGAFLVILEVELVATGVVEVATIVVTNGVVVAAVVVETMVALAAAETWVCAGVETGEFSLSYWKNIRTPIAKTPNASAFTSVEDLIVRAYMILGQMKRI